MVAKMRNAGEACTAANRIYVQSAIHDAFAEKFTQRMAALRVGPGVDPDTECGPMITRKAVEKIDRLVEDAISRGARVLCGGRATGRPRLLLSADGACRMFPRPPTWAARRFSVPWRRSTVSRARQRSVAAANDTEYGLAAYIYTRDIGRGMRVASKVEAGMIALNRGLVSDPAAPFGGVKQSGLGREGGQHHGIAEFMEAKYIATSF